MNLTDNEMEKLLERCVNDDHCGDCPLEYLSDECMEYRSNLLSLALGLINSKKAVNKLQEKQIVDLKIKVKEQKAEIEKYQHIEKTVKDFWSGLKELSAFKDLQEPTLTELLEYIEQTNAEAIKEFAERLKKSTFDCDVSLGYGNGCYVKAVTTIEIDNLVKEMVGE